LLTFVPWVLMFLGPKIRARSKFANELTRWWFRNGGIVRIGRLYIMRIFMKKRKFLVRIPDLQLQLRPALHWGVERSILAGWNPRIDIN
jgi:hypothetical protein